MFGIKKMLKDEEATGIVGAISACLPSTVLFGGVGTIITLLGTICGAILSCLPTAWSIVSLPCCFGCSTGCCTGICALVCDSVCCGVPLILDTIFATAVGTVTSAAMSFGAMFDYAVTCCLTPVIEVFGCSFGSLAALIESLGEIISGMM